MAVESSAATGCQVQRFYDELPFNYRRSAAEHADSIRDQNPVDFYPPLRSLLSDPTTRVLEVGCGVGFLSCAMRYHYACAVTGIDFSHRAIERALEIRDVLRIDVEFQQADLFTYTPARPFDVVVSIGVLHHTADCAAAIRRLATFVRSHGHCLIGLYHRDGRQPFLEHFRDMRRQGASEEEMLARFRFLHRAPADDLHLRSWFRDQVLHPHETQHTLLEVVAALESASMRLVAASLNGFRPFDSVDALVEVEQTLGTLARDRLAANEFFPGFFAVLALKDEAPVGRERAG